MFNVIQIQTYDYCNRSCSFCPNDKNIRKTGNKMSLETFHKILDNLQGLQYKGRISPYMMNEPFLDDRIFMICRFIRDKFPHNDIFCNTNGDWINNSTINELANSPLNRIHINLYCDNSLDRRKSTLLDLFTRNSIFNILDSANQKNDEDKINVYFRAQNELRSFFWNRGGNSSVIRYESVPNTTCLLPSEQMYINYLGQAILCCSDWKFEVVLGDITTCSIEVIWNSDKYNRIRNLLAKKNRTCTELCNQCDY